MVRVRVLAGDIVLFLGKTLSLVVPLSTQVHKEIPANVMLGGPCDGQASHPGRGGGGSRNTPSRLMLQKQRYAVA